MTNNFIYRKNINGFSLLEMTVVLIVMSILASAVIPVLTRSFLDKAGEKVSLDISAIQDAARAYYTTNNSWPTSIKPTGVTPATDLESTGFLPSGWNATNPFGNSYSTSVSGSMFTVSTNVSNGSQIAIVNRLPVSSYSGNTVSSSIPAPGTSSFTGFGHLVAQSVGTQYQATTDGFVEAYNLVNNNNDIIYGYVGVGSPNSLVCIGGTASGSNGRTPSGYGGNFPCSFTVAKGEYYIVQTPSFGTATMYFRSAD